MGGMMTMVYLHEIARPPKAAVAQKSPHRPDRRNDQNPSSIADEQATKGSSIVTREPWASRLGLIAKATEAIAIARGP